MNFQTLGLWLSFTDWISVTSVIASPDDSIFPVTKLFTAMNKTLKFLTEFLLKTSFLTIRTICTAHQFLFFELQNLAMSEILAQKLYWDIFLFSFCNNSSFVDIFLFISSNWTTPGHHVRSWPKFWYLTPVLSMCRLSCEPTSFLYEINAFKLTALKFTSCFAWLTFKFYYLCVNLITNCMEWHVLCSY